MWPWSSLEWERPYGEGPNGEAFCIIRPLGSWAQWKIYVQALSHNMSPMSVDELWADLQNPT